MSRKEITESKRETLNMRISQLDRNLIDEAAKVRGNNRTAFIIEAARLAAEEVLLDQTVIRVSPADYSAFLARLDAPAQPNAQLIKTMRTPAPWD
jgi:uncharacterized protein (DUF1778 family)